MAKDKILITSALLYANGPLHFGHIAGAYLPADCYARFMRMQDKDVLYISGSDEYGVAITMSAELAKRTPREHVDHFHEVNKNLFDKLNFSFDHYSRTTWEGHEKPVHEFFLELLENGYIEDTETDQLFSEKEQRFLADRYVTGTCPACGYENARGDECPKCGASFEATDLKNPRSKMTGSPLVLKKTRHWFLLLDKFKDKLIPWLDSKGWKPNVVNFVKEYIKGLRPRAITRDSNWGVPIPLDHTEGKVLYVWFDAPIGYISATQEWAKLKGDDEKWKEYWLDPKTKLVHFIGKDNIPFHAAIFPAMTMGQNRPYKLVDELPANEFLMLEGKQFSKSEGWYVDLEEFLKRYTTDQIRYCLAANAPETSDSEFTWKDFQKRCNAELLGKFGNFVNRVLVFGYNNCQEKIPEKSNLEDQDCEFLKKIQELVDEASQSYRSFKMRKAAGLIMSLAQLGNTYFDAKSPWSDAKDLRAKSRMDTTIACCFECLKALALISSPIMPDAAQKVWRMIGFSSTIENESWEDVKKGSLSPGTALAKPEILFRKIEDAEIQKEIDDLKNLSKKAKEKKVQTPLQLKDQITFEEFEKLDLRVGTIIAAEEVKKSKKLLKLEVDLGFEKRQVLSGIKESYSPENLIGKKVVLVANLKPAKLMGIESHGMILAAGSDSKPEVIILEDSENGSIVS